MDCSTQCGSSEVMANLYPGQRRTALHREPMGPQKHEGDDEEGILLIYLVLNCTDTTVVSYLQEMVPDYFGDQCGA